MSTDKFVNDIMQESRDKKILEIKMCELEKENKKLRSALEFYADMENWQLRTFNENNVQKGFAMRIRQDDCEFLSGPNRHFGGRRAREVLK